MAATTDPDAVLLFVDDEKNVRESISRILRRRAPHWKPILSACVRDAISVARQTRVDLIVTDMSMPEASGLDLLRRASEYDELRSVPIVMLTGESDESLKRQALDLGALDLLNKPINADDLIARISSALRLSEAERDLRELNLNLEKMVAERTADLQYSRLEIVWRLAKAGQLRDSETGDHLLRVATFSQMLAESLGMSQELGEDLFFASSLHDIGKIGVPDALLQKPGGLTEEESRVVQGHCQFGHSILASDLDLPCLPHTSNPVMVLAAEIAFAHHEKWDGSGYPNALAGDEIPFSARIVAVADVFDALCSERPYKQAMTPEAAAQIVIAGSGSHFDPVVVDAFQRCLPQIAQHPLTTSLVTQMEAA